MKSRVLLGAPEIERLAKGESVTIRLQPDTTELEIRASTIARNRLNPPTDKAADFLKKIMGNGFGGL